MYAVWNVKHRGNRSTTSLSFLSLSPDRIERGSDCDKPRLELQTGAERPHGKHKPERPGLENRDVVEGGDAVDRRDLIPVKSVN